MVTCSCPAATALSSITAVTCAENFGQIQKIAFQRVYSSGTTKNSFTSAAAITAKASWTTFLTANDGTKVVVSPYINNPTSEAGAPRTAGGGNESIGGIEEIIGREPTTFTAQLNGVPQVTIKDMKKLECEAEVGNLGVYLFNEAGKIACLVDPNTATTHYPIPVRSFFVGDKAFGGLEAKDTNALQFSFPPNWSDQLVFVSPADFNPLTDL